MIVEETLLAAFLKKFPIPPQFGSSGYMTEKTYLQPVVSCALYVGGDYNSMIHLEHHTVVSGVRDVGGEYIFSMQSQAVLLNFHVS